MFKRLTSHFPTSLSPSNPSANASNEIVSDSEKTTEDGTMPAGRLSMPSASMLKTSMANIHLNDRLSSKSVSTAASSAATTMMGFMKKAANVTTEIMKEGQAKAVELKTKAMDVADMDALQRKLANVLDGTDSDDENIGGNLNFTYVTKRIIAMGFPGGNSSTQGNMRFNPIDKVAKVLNSRHNQHYMIWNFSEEPYDYSLFNDQVLEFKFPGYPAPPLGLLFKICASIDNWLNADDENVAVIHCLTGKGRTGTVIACYLAWDGQMETPMEALEYVARVRNTSLTRMTIPSQRRYVEYFGTMMNGEKPQSKPFLLKRVIMNTVPRFTEDGCCPYLQIYKNGKLVFTSTWSETSIPRARAEEGSYAFSLNVMLQGDILIRCRHITEKGERISMFRASFHTGYIPSSVLRMTKSQLDGACSDQRFDEGFFLDLIFAEFGSESDSNTLSESTPEEIAQDDEEVKPASSPRKLKNDGGFSVNEDDKEAYDLMITNDQKFWDDLAKRKESRKYRGMTTTQRSEEKAQVSEKPQVSEKSQVPAFITDTKPDVPASPNVVARRSSWDASKDKELMDELRSLTAEPDSVSTLQNRPQEGDSGVELSASKVAGNLQTDSNKVDSLPKLNLSDDANLLKSLDEVLSTDGKISTNSDTAVDHSVEKDVTFNNSTESTAIKSPKRPAPSSNDFDLDNLGIDLDVPSSTGATANKPDDPLNMDELEEYLSSLSSK